MEITAREVVASKRIFESIVTSGLPPEEVLQRLDTYGIDWFVTDTGDLMIKYWQVGAEDFVPKERVAQIKQNQAVPQPTNAMNWLTRNLSNLRSHYANRWIAIMNDEVVEDAEALPALMEKINASRVDNPFVTFIPSEPVVWTTAYANQTV